MKIAILAGGAGTRLWPWSRQSNPKQIMSFNGGLSLLQETYKRLTKGFRPEDILVVAGKKYASIIRRQLPALAKNNLLIEPTRRDSAGAIALAAAYVYKNNPRESLLTIHSDHWIEKEKDYISVLKQLAALTQRQADNMFLIGIKPSYPETGYGYIRVDKKVVHSPVYPILNFIEKPPLAEARRLFKQPGMFWNAGWFGWRVDHLLSLFEKHLPGHADLIKILSAGKARDWQKIVDKEFPKLKSVAIDYGIVEKIKARQLLPFPSGWADIGHWRSVYEMSEKDKNNNVVKADSLLIEAENNIFISQSKKFIAALGVSNLVMVESGDVILLINKDRAHEVKSIIEGLKENARYKNLL